MKRWKKTLCKQQPKKKKKAELAILTIVKVDFKEVLLEKRGMLHNDQNVCSGK